MSAPFRGARPVSAGSALLTAGRLNLLKLSVGTETVEGLAEWQSQVSERRRRDGNDPRPVHVTRMWPRRGEELLDGGSIYWVIKGLILARQRIAALEAVDRGDGVKRCAIVLEPELVRTAAAPRRPFQGWRYLQSEDAPPDLPVNAQSQDLPHELLRSLSDIGVR